MPLSLSLRGRFAIAFAVAFLLVLALVFVTLHILLRGILTSDLDTDLARYGDALVTEATQDGGAATPERLFDAARRGTLERLAGAPILVATFDASGKFVAGSRALPPEAQSWRGDDLQRLWAGQSLSRTITPGKGALLRAGVRPVVTDGQLVALVETAQPLGPVTAATNRLQTLLAIEGAIAAVLATGAGYLIARRGLQPLDEVATLAADIEAHDLTRRLRLARAPEEIRRLADTFDAMLDRIEQAFTLQRTFALDVSHELRTPLTALRGNLDVLLLDPALEGEVRLQIEQLAAETGRLMRLTSNLLALAQSEVGRKLHRADVDLDVVLLEVYQQARTLKPGVRLRLGNEDQVTVQGDGDLLKQLVLNLIENAMKYTPDGGSVTLSLCAEAGWARIVVTDTGPGVSAADLPHIFERFYRAPAGGGRVAGGAGIGLSVARWIATEHGGSIDVESAPGEGASFVIRLPLQRDSAPGQLASSDEQLAPVDRDTAAPAPARV